MSNAAVFLGGADVSVAAAGALGGAGTIGDPLTVEVDGDTITIVGNQLVAASSGGSIFHQAQKPLTNAQIIHLPTTPIEVVAAPVAGHLLIPVSGCYIIDTTGGAYASVNASAILGLGPNFEAFGAVYNDAGDSVTNLTDLLTNGAVTFWHMSSYQQTVASGLATSDVWGDYVPAAEAINVRINNQGTGILTAGHASNSGLVSVVYLEMVIATGVFV